MVAAKVTARELKDKEKLVKEMLEFYGYNWNDWLYDIYMNYITEHVSQYVEDQANQSNTNQTGTAGVSTDYHDKFDQ